jgi:hypothetical protein
MTLASSNTGNQYQMSRYGSVSKKMKGGRMGYGGNLRGGNLTDNLRKVGTVVKGQITRQRVKKICDILDAGLKGTSMDKPKPRAKKPKAKAKPKKKKPKK